METTALVPLSAGYLDLAIEKWLEASFVHSQSERTVKDYRKTMLSFRLYLQSQGTDIDGNADILRFHLQAWATLRSPKSKRSGVIAPATYNLRLATISSFYQYARQSLRYAGENPVELCKRAKVQRYGKVRPLPEDEVQQQLKSINRQSLEGHRDYVLLQVALNTGRRAKELASLRWRHVTIEGNILVLTFEECKGHKTMYDALSPRLSKSFLSYLKKVYGDLSRLEPESPLFVSFSDRNQHQAIGIQTIANICKTRLGVSTVHSTRHTFAHALDELGASPSEIQARLGHESLATTGVYLARLKSAYNPYAEKLADAFGLEDEDEA